MLASLLAVAAFAAQVPAQPRDAPWRLTGISSDGQTLHLTYEGGGCLGNDGRAEVDTSDPAAVRITVKQTQAAGEYAVCPAFIAFLPLDVDLGAPLAGREVTGGPRWDTTLVRPRRMPRVLGLRRADALRALDGQSIATTPFGRIDGVVHVQDPRPGRRLRAKRRASVITGPFDPRARLAITVPARQTAGSVLRRGLRFRYTLDPAAEKAIDALVDCNGQDGGEAGRATRRDRGSARVRIANRRLQQRMRRRARSTCRLTVMSFTSDPRGIDDWLVRRTVRVTLKNR